MEVYAESNVKYFDEDGGCVVNVSDEIVLLKKADAIDLVALFKEFDAALRAELLVLLTMKYGEAVGRYGLLGFNASLLEERRDVPVGFLLRGAGTKLAVFKDQAVVSALVRRGMIPGKTPQGLVRKRYPRESGAMGDMLCGLPYEQQKQIIGNLLEADLDGVLLTNQRDEIGMGALRVMLSEKRNQLDALATLADWIERQVATPDRSADAFHGKGSGKLFAPLWFGQFLASRGVWLLPMRFFDRLLAFYPDHLRPILPLLSVPPHARDIADTVIGSAPRSKTTLQQALGVFVMAALSSTMWSERRFCPAPLYQMKIFYGTANAFRSASINHVFKLLSDVFDIDLRSRDEAMLLRGRKKLNSIEAFHWTSDPTPANTRLAAKLLGRSVDHVPEHTRILAEEMRGLLSSFKVQYLRPVEAALNLFLIYTLVLKPGEAPTRLRDIRAEAHVRSFASPHETFWQFLSERCPHSKAREATMSKMRQLWQAASIRDGFATELECPFDPRRDTFGAKKNDVARAGRAIEQVVIDLLVELNKEGDYAFARSIERYHFVVRDRDGRYEKVFWPAVAIALEICLRLGLRLRSVRWLDSGEGDEHWYDPATMSYTPNPLACAVEGRQQFFIEKTILDDVRRTEVNGMFVNVAKGGSYRSPYFPDELVDPVCRMRDLQIRYNPMRGPIPAIDNKSFRPDTQKSLFVEAFPLLREPEELAVSITEDKVRGYYKAFLIHAQPIIEARLGRPYPLVDVDLDTVLTTIHDHRRSFVTNGDEAGIPISVMRVHLGMKSNAMVNVYNRVRDHRIHSQVQQASYNRDLLEGVAQDDPKALSEMVAQVSATMGNDAPAARRLKDMQAGARAAFLDLLLHCLCVSGDCSTGGRMVNGVRQPVFRPRACGGCSHRASSWAHRAGIVARTRILTIEIRQAAQQRADLERAIDEAERKGASVHALERSRRSAEYLYRNLSNELRLEQEWLRKVDVAAHAARQAGRSPSSVVLANGTFDYDRVETTQAEIHDFELLHSVLKDALFMPAALLELPPSVPLEFERQMRQILAANRQEEVLRRIPSAQKTEALVAIGDLLLDAFGDPDEFQRLLEASENDVPDAVVAELAAAIRGAASNPTMIGS